MALLGVSLRQQLVQSAPDQLDDQAMRAWLLSHDPAALSHQLTVACNVSWCNVDTLQVLSCLLGYTLESDDEGMAL